MPTAAQSVPPTRQSRETGQNGSGPVVAAVGGTIGAIAAATGGLVGALIGWGIPDEHVKRYEAGIKDGGILMSVKTRSVEDAKALSGEWRKHRGEDVYG